MKRAVFHIGYPKTGTSTIQHFLSNNRYELLKHGYYYAERSYIERMGNADDVYHAGLPGFDQKALKKIFDHDIENSGGRVLLYSHEAIFSLGEDFFRFIEEYFDELKIIIYLRRQDEWVESYMRWQIAAGYPQRKSKHDAPYSTIDYWKVLKRIEHSIKSKAIIVRPFARSAFYQGDLNCDFLNTLDIPEEAFDAFDRNIDELNKSLDGKALVFKQLLNRYLPLKIYRIKNSKDTFGPWRGTRINRVLSRYISEANGRNFQVLSVSEKLNIMRRVRQGNKKISKKYLCGENPFEAEKRKNKGESISTDMTPEEIKDMAVFAFNEFMNNAGEVSKEYLLACAKTVLETLRECAVYAEQFKRDKELLEKSGFFDKKYYFNKNRDLHEGTDAILHYLLVGHKQDLDPSNKFNTAYYKREYAEDLSNNMPPLVHYLTIGKQEGKRPKL